jgi:hypothetical protein
MAKVFIAGHGRMLAKSKQNLPPSVTMKWAVPEKHNGSSSLSTALLTGVLDDWAEEISNGAEYAEHFLCPDPSYVMSSKGKFFVQGNWAPAQRHYLLQPRYNFATPLSAILDYLRQVLGGQLEVCWTCCRSPIHEVAIGKVEYKGGKVEITKYGAGKSPTPAPDEKPTGADAMMVQAAVKLTGAGGGVTLLCATEGAVADKDSTWPGPTNKAPKGAMTPEEIQGALAGVLYT